MILSSSTAETLQQNGNLDLSELLVFKCVESNNNTVFYHDLTCLDQQLIAITTNRASPIDKINSKCSLLYIVQ